MKICDGTSSDTWNFKHSSGSLTSFCSWSYFVLEQPSALIFQVEISVSLALVLKFSFCPNRKLRTPYPKKTRIKCFSTDGCKCGLLLYVFIRNGPQCKLLRLNGGAMMQMMHATISFCSFGFRRHTFLSNKLSWNLCCCHHCIVAIPVVTQWFFMRHCCMQHAPLDIYFWM